MPAHSRELPSFLMSVLAIVLLTAAAQPVACAAAATQSRNALGAPDFQAAKMPDLSPAIFVENKGQWDAGVRYGLCCRNTGVSFTDSGLVFQTLRTSDDNRAHQDVSFSAHFAGANRVTPVGLDPSATVVNYYVGNDPARWRPNVPSFEKILYKGLYDGVDLYTWGKQAGLKYEFHLAAGVSWRQIVVRYEGIDGLSLDAAGRLHAKTASGEMVDDAPVVYQEQGGQRIEIPARFRLMGDSSYGFEITGAVDPALPLVIDPSLVWSSYLGGSDQDQGTGVVLDASGDCYVVGSTASSDFPTAGGFSTTLGGVEDAFVAKITSSGTLAWSTYFGGTGDDYGFGIAIDSGGNCYLTGSTASSDFPTTGGFDTSLDGPTDAFVAKITSSGTLVWSSYLGGWNNDIGWGIAATSAGDCYLTGYTESWDFPNSGGFDPTYGGGTMDAFVAKVTTSGTLAWSSFLGGSGEDRGSNIAVDSAGNCYFTGYTESSDLPTSGGFDTTLGGTRDAFVTKVTSSGTLAWSSYLGGSGIDQGSGITADGPGNVYLSGVTWSSDFPTPGGFDTTLGGTSDAFVTHVSSSGTLVWSSYLGGSGDDWGNGIVTGSEGPLYVTGWTQSSDFPTTGGFDSTFGGNMDAFVARVLVSGALSWSSYLGGSGGDCGVRVAVNGTGNCYVTGQTWSSDFPTPGGFDTSLGGPMDAFVAKLLTPANLVVVTGGFPNGSTGVAYSQTLLATGGVQPYVSWSIISGSLPAGLSLNASSGVISGTPAIGGVSAFTVQVTDSQLPTPATATRALSITVIPSGPTYHFATSDAETSTTSTSFTGKVTLSFTPPAQDDWIVFGFCEFKCPNVNYATFVQLFIDGAGEGQNTRKPVNPTDYLPFITVKVKTLSAGPHTMQLKYRSGNASAAAFIRRARICAVRKAALEFWNVAQDSAVPITVSLADIVTLNWTPAATGNYLVISTAEINASTAVSTDLQTLYNGVLNDEGVIRAADNGDYTTFMSFNYCANAPAGVPIAHKISAKKVAADPVNHYVRRARILALRLSNGRFNTTAAGSGTQRTTPLTSFQIALATTWTYGVSGNWLFLNSARLNNSSLLYQTELKVAFNSGTTCAQQLMRMKNTTDLLNFSSIDVRNVTTPRTVEMDVRTTNAAGTAMVKRLRFYGLPLDAP